MKKTRYQAAMAAVPVLLLSLALGCSQGTGQGGATLALVNARIWTGNPDQPWAEALAVERDKITAIGSEESIRPHLGAETEVIDAGGGLVCPGFIDTHVHFLDGGFQISSVQLRDAATPEEFTERIRAYAAGLEAGTWILGGIWDHTLWGGELPRRDWIDAATPEHPVWIQRLDGHMGLANSRALELAGLSKATADVDGGTIVRDERGELTGILKDNAMALVNQAVPQPSDALKLQALEAAMRHVAAQGVTTVHDMGRGWDLDFYLNASPRTLRTTRVYVAAPLAMWERLQSWVTDNGIGDDWVRFGALKGYVDGSLGSHTAAFNEPFTDAPEDTGLLINDPEELYQWISGADRAQLRVMVHAIGDRAITLLLDTFERVAQENGERDRRFRMEHAQHIAPADIPRFASLGVIASMQPYHAIDDGRWAEDVIGPERIKTTYAFRSLLDAGAPVAFGSDWTVAPATPIEGIYAAVTRATLDGANPDGWVPEQKIRVEEALHAYTVAGAQASFEEHLKGSLEPGKLADLVVIDRDLTAIPPEEIRDAQVVVTVTGGRVVYQRP